MRMDTSTEKSAINHARTRRRLWAGLCGAGAAAVLMAGAASAHPDDARSGGLEREIVHLAAHAFHAPVKHASHRRSHDGHDSYWSRYWKRYWHREYRSWWRHHRHHDHAPGERCH